jgi:hypothetical protein
MSPKWKRRDFLRTVGLAGLLAPVAGYWPDLQEARALTEKRNMVLIFLPNGKVRENPFVTDAAGGWEYGDGFRPYNAFRDRSIAIEEYGFQDFIDRHYSGDHGGHVAPGVCMFTGDVAYAPGGQGRGGIAPSLDQIVAWDYLNRGVITNPLRKSLNIKVTGSSFRSPSVFFQTPADYALNRTYSTEVPQVSLTSAPRDGFAQMFGDIAGTAGGATVEDLWLQGRSILDVPAAELETLKPTLPAEGRALLDQHLYNLRELERGLAAEDVEAPITPPDPPSDIGLTPENHVRVLGQWFDIVDAALRLDRTRIVTMQFGGIASRFHVPELGLGFVGTSGDSNSGSDHHSYTHHRGADVPQFMTWFSERIAELLTRLTGTGSEPRSDILTDSTVMVGMEFGWNHRAYDVPVTLFGEGGGYFRTGQRLRYGNDLAQYHKHTGTLLAIARSMGVEGLDLVGHDMADYQRGPIPELLA